MGGWQLCLPGREPRLWPYPGWTVPRRPPPRASRRSGQLAPEAFTDLPWNWDMPCIGCPTSSPPRPAERASLSERRGLGRVGDHLEEDPRKDRCPPPKCFLLPMPRAPGASSDPQVPGAGVLSGAPWHSALLHPSPLQGPNLGSGAVIWEKSLRYKFALSPRCQGKGGFFFNYFIHLCILFSVVLGLRCRMGFLSLQRAGATLGCHLQASPRSVFSCC